MSRARLVIVIDGYRLSLIFRMEPLDESQCGAVIKSTDEDLLHYENLSFKEIAAGNVGILLLAGGQGTR